eukprot:COSAG01_NODE_1759_length_9301_cov_24.140622_3_plen_41_part_00
MGESREPTRCAEVLAGDDAGMRGDDENSEGGRGEAGVDAC